MIVCKYVRRGTFAYIPHVDMVRYLGMAVRRCKADVAFSEGFNPHRQLFLSAPMPLGCESECEYFAAVSTEEPDTFLRKMNATLPDELRIVQCGYAEKCNPAGVITAAEYEIRLPGVDCAAAIAGVLERDTFTIEYADKGVPVVKEVRSKIYGLSACGDAIRAVLGYGNNNLRPDRLAYGLCRDLPDRPKILKKKMYTTNDGRLADADYEFFGRGLA